MHKIIIMAQDEEMDEAQGGDNPKMKSCSGGQKCWSGGQGKSVSGKARFSLKPLRKRKGDEVEEPEGRSANETHQNARDLGGDSGDVSYYGQINNTGTTNYDTSAKTKMKKMEVDRTATKKYFGK